LQQTDRLIASLPEVERVFGKIGRADTATDPAPLTRAGNVAAPRLPAARCAADARISTPRTVRACTAPTSVSPAVGH